LCLSGTPADASVTAISCFSIPDRVLGFLCLLIAETLLYLVFEVQFRRFKPKLPFQPVFCQYPILTVASKSYPAKLTGFP
jgi:hypothetical protein